MRTFLFSAFAVMLLAACNTSDSSTTGSSVADPRAQIQDGATQYHDIGIGGGFYNECCDEGVTISGIGHYVARKNGGSHINVSDMTATGASGREYTQQGALTQHFSYDATTGDYDLILQGRFMSDDGCSFRIKWTVHFHYNANGELTADVQNYEISCLDD
jgi:hypothetical protein